MAHRPGVRGSGAGRGVCGRTAGWAAARTGSAGRFAVINDCHGRRDAPPSPRSHGTSAPPPLMRTLATAPPSARSQASSAQEAGSWSCPPWPLLGGLSMPVAIGISLLVIALQSVVGFAGHLGTAALDWPLTLIATGGPRGLQPRTRPPGALNRARDRTPPALQRHRAPSRRPHPRPSRRPRRAARHGRGQRPTGHTARRRRPRCVRTAARRSRLADRHRLIGEALRPCRSGTDTTSSTGTHRQRSNSTERKGTASP